MGAAHRGNRRRMARDGEPVMNRGADAAALHWRLAGAMVAGDQQHDASTTVDCAIQGAIDGVPGTIEAHPVKVEGQVGLDIAGAEAAVPGAVEGRADRPRCCSRRRRPLGASNSD